VNRRLATPSSTRSRSWNRWAGSSAGLAHEINSPIQFVGDNARFLEEAYQELIRVVEIYRELLDTSNPIGWIERQERVRQAEAGIDFDFLQKEIPSAVEQTLEGIERVSTIVGP
jgi:hypothetical protein